MSNKSIRIRTKPGGDDNYIRVNLNQDFNQLQILSLSIDQEDLYRSFSANYGVIAGRVDINNGFGLKNAKVSIFIPLSAEDQANEVISQLYPYKSLEDLNSNGVRYNLLPRKQQSVNHTPTGTFPDKRQILDSPTMVEVYDKYYKFTTTTNEAGDYMFFGVPIGSQQIFIDVDVSDIGFLSTRPYELMSQGISEEKFESKFKFKNSSKLDELPQIISTSSSIDVLPFWADDLSQGTEFGITRFDYSVTEYELTPTAIFMGSMFSDNENDSLSKNCRPKKKMGEMNDLITGAGKIEAITRTQDGDIVLSQDIPEDAVDENGNWAIQLPMTMRKLVTDEFGALVPSPDNKKGIASESDYRFRISMEPNKNDKSKRTRAKMLVPNMTGNYKFGEFSKTDLLNAEAANEPIFKVNEQLSYETEEDNAPLKQYNYLEDFFTFRWKKVYTVRQYIPRYQPNKNDDNKNFIGFKNISDAVGVNKIPFNRLFTKINPIYRILCFILTLFAFIVGFINTIIQILNNLISNICEIRIPFPCFDVGRSAGACTQVKYKFNGNKWNSGEEKWEDENISGNISKDFAFTTTNSQYVTVENTENGPVESCWVKDVDGKQEIAKNDKLNIRIRYGDDDKSQNGLPTHPSEGTWFGVYPGTTIKQDGKADWWYDSSTCRDAARDGGTIPANCKRVKYDKDEYIDNDLACVRPEGYTGFAVKITLFGLIKPSCLKVLFNLKSICPVKGLCNKCTNDDECGNPLECDVPDYAKEFRYKWERPDKTEQGKCLDRAVFITPSTLPTECESLGLEINKKYFAKDKSERGKTFTGCDVLDELEKESPTDSEIVAANDKASDDAFADLDAEKINVFKCDTLSDCACKKGGKIEDVTIGCLRALGYGTETNTRSGKNCMVGDGEGKGINQYCCNGCKDCDQNGKCEEGDSNSCKKECVKDCLAGCCEKIPLIKLNCPEEGKPPIKPQLFEIGRCTADKIVFCESCKGPYFNPISDWVACRLESVATFFSMLDFEFYNDWMNGSLYFPLIKRNLKIKRAKKAAKGKSLKRGQGQIQKDVFCDYDCDGGVKGNPFIDKPDYQHPDKETLYSVKLRGGGVVDFTFEGCKVTLPKRISGKQWYDTVDKVYRTIEFKGNYVDDISKGCTFTLSEYCESDGVTCGNDVKLTGTDKKIIIKEKKIPGEHGKPKYIKSGEGSDVAGKRISIWENVGGHGHHKNKCKKNYFIEKEEYTKTDLSDCMSINRLGLSGDTGIAGVSIASSIGDPIECEMSCSGQGAMACSRNCACDSKKYNLEPNYRGVIKWEEDELYYVSIKDERDSEEDKSEEPESNTGFEGGGNFDQLHYKKNMFFPTNITELGSSVFCDIDEAPFIIDDLEPTSYKVSEEGLKVSTKGIPNGVDVKYRLQEKEGNINLRSYVDFGCTGVKCMNVRSSVVQSQVGTELFDTNDTGLECGSCKSYVDVDTDIRQYFCQRFSTFVPNTTTTNFNIGEEEFTADAISDMKVNYIRPGGSQGENYYEPYNDIRGVCDTFEGANAIVDGGTDSIDVINIDNEVNDNEFITPGDKCGYLTRDGSGLDFKNVKYFYAMDLTEEHTKKELKSFPFEESKLGSEYNGSIDIAENPILVNDDEGISLFSTQTPYFFYFGLVPGKTALNKVVGKFFADKIDAETLETISNGGTNETIVPPNSNKTTSPQSIIGSCVNS